MTLLFRTRTALLGLTLLMCALCCSQGALAQRDGADYETIAQAVDEFNQGHWQEARALFRKAHEAHPNARTWRSLGITAFELRRYVDAVAELEAALADPRKPLTERQRSEVEALLVRTRQLVSVYRVKVTPLDAEVLVDGQVATLVEGKLFLDPGQHTVVVRAGGYEERRADLSVAAGVDDELALELTVVDDPEVPPVSAARTEPATVAPPTSARTDAQAPRRRWTWALGGTALATAGVGLGTGIAAARKLETHQACEQSCASIKRDGQQLQLMTNLAFGVSGAFLIGATIAFFVEARGGPRSSETAIVVTPDQLSFVQTF